ncbi:hypothetical protein AB0F17_64875 [Nonomuraea sp. NPDC026600]
MCVKCERHDLAIKYLAETKTDTLGLTIDDAVELGQELQERGYHPPIGA